MVVWVVLLNVFESRLRNAEKSAKNKHIFFPDPREQVHQILNVLCHHLLISRTSWFVWICYNKRRELRRNSESIAPFFSLILFLAATKSLRRDPRSIPVILAAWTSGSLQIPKLFYSDGELIYELHSPTQSKQSTFFDYWMNYILAVCMHILSTAFEMELTYLGP